MKSFFILKEKKIQKKYIHKILLNTRKIKNSIQPTFYKNKHQQRYKKIQQQK